jgi:hypothetical protein
MIPLKNGRKMQAISLYKIKLGTKDELKLYKNSKHTDAAFRVDANTV